MTVVVDATVIIHLAKAGKLHLLGSLERWHFVVPDQVVEEVSYPEQAAALARALAEGQLRQESSTDLNEMASYAVLRQRMGSGEAACISMAGSRGWLVASDDQGKAFKRLVRERIGDGRLIDTAQIIHSACERRLLSEDEAATISSLARGDDIEDPEKDKG
jgi:predicted nucleic acid-binding protein